MKTWTATALTFMRTASSMSTAMRSSESSFRMLGPPLARMTTALVCDGSMTERRIPRVSINASAEGMSGLIVISTRSSPVCGALEIPVIEGQHHGLAGPRV